MKFTTKKALLMASTLFALSAQASVPEGWFAWPSQTPLAGTALDASPLNQVPAGALGRVRIEKGQFVDGSGARLRFWGANLGAQQAFPRDAEEARLIARRLSTGGVNIARLHHLDNTWGIGTGGSLWRADRKDHLEFDPTQLSRLHRLIAELKAEGIYSNVNLKVSKSLSEEDGFPASIKQVPDFQKRVDIFQRRMIDLQKDYARRLLTTKNPFTGLSLIEDPAVAVIELNNENSLLGFWTRDLGRGTHRFAEPFRTELEGLWNNWLGSHYADVASLEKAWAPGAGALGASLPTTKEGWLLGCQRGSSITPVKDEASGDWTLTIANSTGTDWHSQAGLGEFHLQDGVAYTVELEASADRERKANVVVGLSTDGLPGAPWRSMGLYDPITLTKERQVYRLSFVAHSVGGEAARLNLNIGQSDGTITVHALRIAPGSLKGGLHAGQNFTDKTIPIPQEASSTQWADWLHFLADTERSWADEMRSFLVKELGVTAPMVGSQIEYGGLIGAYREQEMDFADSHSYWQHPDFGASGMWDPANWTIKNSPQLAEFNDRTFGELGSLAMNRIAGKPFTISEYDHPAPSEYVCEMYPVSATFGARQDWDGIYPFAIDEYGTPNQDGRISSFFDQQNHPAKWGFSPAASRIFRHGLIPSAPKAVLKLGSPLWAESPHADVLWRKLLGKDGIDFLNTAFGVSDRPLPAGQNARLEQPVAHTADAPILLSKNATGEVYAAHADQVAVLSGYLGGNKAAAGPLEVSCDAFGINFLSVTTVALDERPLPCSQRILLTVAARAENQDMGWNELRTTVNSKWGHGPTIAERVPAHFSLAVDGPRKIYALAPDGTHAREIKTRFEKGILSWDVSPEDNTLHYEILSE